MAPTRPIFRPHHHPLKFSSTLSPSNKHPNKKSKLQAKHASLLSRITASAPPNISRATRIKTKTNSTSNRTTNAKIHKRRRPSKKLVTSLRGLESALPDIESPNKTSAGNKDGEEDVERRDTEGRAKIKQKSLKSRPGAMRRKEMVVRKEMERFQMNMAILGGGGSGVVGAGSESRSVWGVVGEGMGESEGPGVGAGGSRSAARWAAVRAFVQRNMEVRKEG